MKTFIKKKPRKYKVGVADKIIIKDFGKIKLNNNEQISFVGNKGLFDFCKKDWGFYATPSINKRLHNNKFQTFLVKNIYNNIYLWVVENNKKKLFLKYLNDENHEIIIRLDEIKSEKNLLNLLKTSFKNLNDSCKGLNKCIINNQNIQTIYNYKFKPKNEPNYKIKNYKRKILQCKKCKHFFAYHKINTSNLYKKNYSLISHGKDLKIKFKKILKLKDKSDNFHRVKRILSFFKNLRNKKINLLDIGSGLGIFLFSLKKKVNWKMSGIEPDKNSYNFTKNVLNLNISNNSFENKKIKRKFEIVTLNKVIEHVKNPISFLIKTRNLIKKKGYIYIEVPDGVAAKSSKEGKNREEFFLDHLHIFSIKSLNNCLIKSNFKVLKIESIKEKSGKYTIFAFAQVN